MLNTTGICILLIAKNLCLIGSLILQVMGMLKLNNAFPQSLKTTDIYRRTAPNQIITESEIERVLNENKKAALANNEASSLFFWGVILIGLSIIFDIPIDILPLLD